MESRRLIMLTSKRRENLEPGSGSAFTSAEFGMASKCPRVYIKTFGCQMNVRDSEVVSGILTHAGYRLIDDERKADIILFNTCSVRQHAEDKVWSEVGRIAKQRKKGESSSGTVPLIGIIGCMAQNYKEALFERAPQVDFAVGPSDIHKIPGIINKLSTIDYRPSAKSLFERKIWETDGEGRPEGIYHTGFYEDKKHAFVVISEGCSNFCSYCVVPYVRGGLKHRGHRDILREIEQAIKNGISRITLLGQNVNAYKDKDLDFVKLIKLVDSVGGLKEFSFLTSHPKDAGIGLFQAMAGSKKLKKYLHLPVQAGSDRVLKLMNRGYTRNMYLDLVKNYRKIVKGSCLTTDIIVGFPSETEGDFKDTYNLVKEINFDSAYVFKYSPRTQAAAFMLPDDISREVKEKRHALILNLQKAISKRARKLAGILAFCVLSFSLCCYAADDDIDKVKACFLSGDYKAAISAGEKAMANTAKTNARLDELYYLLGLSYMKEGNYLRASDIFEIIINEMQKSSLRQDAELALGDSYFLRQDYARAEAHYRELLAGGPDAKLLPLLYYRLSQVSLKNGDSQQAGKYLDKLKKDYPLCVETTLNKDMFSSGEVYYSVQVGSFSNITNAQNLVRRLLAKGYPAYLEKIDSAGRPSYRVRVGKASERREAVELENKLIQEGYPTKVCP